MFGRQRKKKEGQQHHQYEVANKYVFKCRLKVDSDDDDVTNDGKLFHARATSRSIVTGVEEALYLTVLVAANFSIINLVHFNITN